jgi:hypothetical protein
VRGFKAKQLRREAERVGGGPLDRHEEREYQIAETTVGDRLYVTFRTTGARGYYRWLKGQYKNDVPFRHAWNRRFA